MGGSSPVPEAGDGSDQSLSTADFLTRYGPRNTLFRGESRKIHHSSGTRRKGQERHPNDPAETSEDMVELRGTYEELTARKNFYENTSYPADYVHITLTDEEDILKQWADCGSSIRT